MTMFFTQEHFELLDKWKDKKFDPSSLEQQHVYKTLKKAYSITEKWANAVQAALFPEGYAKIRKGPTNQANKFTYYNWGRIYPSKDSPKELAYTVGIDCYHRFIVKIDTFNVAPTLRAQYEKIRGPFDNRSPIIATLPEEEGLSKSFPELVTWSIETIHRFKNQYDDIAAKLGLTQPISSIQSNHLSSSIHSAEKKSMPPFNRIYYGPPGTGKTYKLTQLLKHYEHITHSAEEQHVQLVSEKIAKLTWWEGIAAALYDLGGKATVTALLKHEFIQAIIAVKSSNLPAATLWATLQNHTVEKSNTVKTKKRFSPAVFDKSATDSIWFLTGDWKETCSELIELVDQLKTPPKQSIQRHYRFVTFHQSYGYEEFVEGLRPLLNTAGETGEIQYEIRPGVFKELCRLARANPAQRYAIVIDEINRGNISKIFGELITLIEPDKREDAQQALSISLPYSGDTFSVPSNIDIIGTMNTADRSLALLDTALRRRFEFIPLLPDTRDKAPEGAEPPPLAGLRVTYEGQTIHIPNMLEAINQRIEALYDREHCIGHAYFIKLKNEPDGEKRFSALKECFQQRILPLLEEYFFEDWQKIRLVLADNQKSEECHFITEEDHEVDLKNLFGTNHDLETYTTRKRYRLNEMAFSNPKTYIGIYETQPSLHV